MNHQDQKRQKDQTTPRTTEDNPDTNSPAPDLLTIKTKVKATWMDGDYAEFSTYMEPGAREILKGWNVVPGERFLDVGCGAGQLVIPAAETGVEATGIDVASNLIDYARTRAAREGLTARFDEGDAEQLPYEDGAFDVVVSLIGAMFAPQPQKVASELARVCRPGGRLYMANWTSTGMVGKMFAVISRYAPPPPGLVSPLLWGDEATVRERLSGNFSDLILTRRFYPLWRYPFSEAELVEFFRRLFGPMRGAFARLDETKQQALKKDLIEVYSSHNQATDGTTDLQGEFLEIKGIRC